MAVLHSLSRLPIARNAASRHTSPSLFIRSSLPFSKDKARFQRELDAAVNVVERACSICIDVNKSLLSNSGRVVEKNDQTPVTVADFSVQALISLELGRLFPDIPLVAEEDSAFLRSSSSGSLVDCVVSAVVDKAGGNGTLTSNEILGAIDRGGMDAASFDSNPATYWVLDPIDGTRGFLKGAQYVVGLSLLVEGEIALGVMGCPNWKEDFLSNDCPDNKTDVSGSGIVMVSHVGCGTWKRKLGDTNSWERCFVDSCSLVYKGRFCLPDSQTWDLLPFSSLFSSTVDPDGIDDDQTILILPTCCGSLVKYMMVASGRASVFIMRAKSQTLIKVWDHAAGVLCVHEAGGQVTDWRGSHLDNAADEVARRIIYPSGGVLVSNGHLHTQVLEMISSNP